MLRILLSISSVLAACAPSPQKAAMPSPSHVPGTTAQGSNKSSPLADSPAEAQGRRILSTAFVRMGPGGHLTVELRNGHVLALRDVVMGPKDYCGMQVAGDSASAKYCGAYAEVAAARPGAEQAVSSPVEAASGTPEAK
jgi:hypothetical protein